MHIPVIFHNLSGYDSHIIMKGIGAMECPDDIEPIPYNMEKYMAFKRTPPTTKIGHQSKKIFYM